MKRSPLVVMGTMAGLAGVLSFNAAPAKLTIGSLPSTPTNGSSTTVPTSGPTGTTTAPTTTTPSAPSTTTTPSAPSTTTTTAPHPSTTTTTSGVRTATGSAVNYFFGILSVKVTASGSKITNVAIASIDDSGNYRSQSIDQMAIPQLEQQAISAQSSKIQGVSGASYTSAGFAQSLQSALTSLGL